MRRVSAVIGLIVTVCVVGSGCSSSPKVTPLATPHVTSAIEGIEMQALLDSSDAYMKAVFSGDGETAYSFFSQHCRDVNRDRNRYLSDIADFGENLSDYPYRAPYVSLEFAWDVGDEATVSYDSGKAGTNDFLWIREAEGWRYNDC